MNQLGKGVVIELSAREIEILGQSYQLLEELLAVDLNNFDRLSLEHGFEMASIKFPRGRNIIDLLQVMEQFRNIYEFNDTKAPF